MDSVNYSTILLRHKRAFRAGCMKSAEQRIEQLNALERLVKENEEELKESVFRDIRRSNAEVYMFELGMVYNEIGIARSSLRQWMKPEPRDKALLFVLDTPEVHMDPLGTVLVIGAWNYPINLTLVPIVAALAAGNCVVLKPSEVSSVTAACLARLVPKYLSPDVMSVVLGGVPETTELLTHRFDHIFYTGSPNVGKIVMAAAAKHLTPVTLELGGKCPAIVDDTGDIKVVAKRIAWGKFMSCGQTCLAPDHVLVHSKVKDAFVKHMIEALEEFYTEDASKADDYSRIISKRQFDRLLPLLSANQKTLYGGKTDASALYISPTIVEALPSDAIMKEEIFGPILPIVTIDSVDEAIDLVNDGEKPLAVYIFSTNRKTVDKVLSNTSSGGVTVNDIMLHMGCDSLPFGGVGTSGMGNYHGKWGFDTFSHKKAVLRRPQMGDGLFWIRYPPLTAQKFKIAKFLTHRLPFYNVKLVNWLLTLLFGVAIGAAFTVFCNRYCH